MEKRVDRTGSSSNMGTTRDNRAERSRPEGDGYRTVPLICAV